MKKGFTLIELLVVIAIIAILATVVIMNVMNARVKAQKAHALDSLSSAARIANACKAFSGNVANGSAGTAICSGATGDADEVATTTGDWPDLSGDNFTYSTPAGSNIAVASIDDGDASTSDPTVTCTLNGCTTSNW